MNASNKIKAVIADDEPLVRERIITLLGSYQKFEIIGVATNGIETVNLLQKHNVDVLFLDIKMPGLQGFDVLDNIDKSDILTVFITAYSDFAIKAFEYAAFDYLLKPISKARFNKSLVRISDHIHSFKNKSPFVVTKEGDRNIRIMIKDISHLEAADNYVKIHTEKKTYSKRSTFGAMLEELESSGFIRVHRSYAVNENYVKDLSRIYQGDYLIRLHNGRVIPSSKSFREAVRHLLGKA